MQAQKRFKHIVSKRKTCGKLSPDFCPWRGYPRCKCCVQCSMPCDGLWVENRRQWTTLAPGFPCIQKSEAETTETFHVNKYSHVALRYRLPYSSKLTRHPFETRKCRCRVTECTSSQQQYPFFCDPLQCLHKQPCQRQFRCDVTGNVVEAEAHLLHHRLDFELRQWRRWLPLPPPFPHPHPPIENTRKANRKHQTIM